MNIEAGHAFFSRQAAILADPGAVGRLGGRQYRAIREGFAEAVAALSPSDAQSLLATTLVEPLCTIIAMRQEPFASEAEIGIINRLTDRLGDRLDPETLPAFLALLPYRPPYRLPPPPSVAAFSPPVDLAVLRLLTARPLVTAAPGDAAAIAGFATALLDGLTADLERGPDPTTAARVRTVLADFPTLQALVTDDGLKPLMQRRARLMEWHLRRDGHDLDLPAAGAPPAAGRGRRLRLAVIISQAAASPEGFFNLAHIEALDRRRIAVSLFATHPRRPDDFADRLIGAAEHYEELAGPIGAMAAAVRATAPDIALIGGNIVAATNDHARLAWLAAFRLAPLQGVNMCTPTTTGLAAMDFYLSGDSVQPPGAEADFTERLLRLPGGIKQFAVPAAPVAPPVVPPGVPPGALPAAAPAGDRAAIGLPAGATVLMSGANFHKIIPELSTAWIEILARSRGTVLALFPFNPNWSPVYMSRPFLQRLSGELAAAGVDPARLLVLRPQDDPAAVRAYIDCADLYLDSHPYSGAVSLLDPLHAGVPPVAWRGRVGRARQGGSILLGLGLDDLIADSRQDYVALAARLAGDPAARADAAARTRAAMARRPTVLDVDDMGRKVTAALLDLARPAG